MNINNRENNIIDTYKVRKRNTNITVATVKDNAFAERIKAIVSTLINSRDYFVEKGTTTNKYSLTTNLLLSYEMGKLINIANGGLGIPIAKSGDIHFISIKLTNLEDFFKNFEYYNSQLSVYTLLNLTNTELRDVLESVLAF